MNAQRPVSSGVFIGLITLFLLLGCASFQPAASIRVEVDVYKGPLSKPIEAQKAELRGIVKDAALMSQQIAMLQDLMNKCEPTFLDLYSCEIAKNFVLNFRQKLCHTFFKLPYVPFDIAGSCGYKPAEQERINKLALPNSSKEEYFQLLTFLGEIAAEMKIQSAAISAAMIPYLRLCSN